MPEINRWTRREVGSAGARPAAPAERPEVADPEVQTTFIHAGCQLDGRLVLPRSIRIDGEYRGAIESEENVVIGESAAVEARIRARSVVIHGAVVGDIEATREVVVHGTGRLHGDVETPSLVIERGAVFNGSTRMFRPERVAQARTAVTAPPAS